MDRIYKMKITKRQLRRIIREELRRSELIQEGWFTAGMKGILRAVPIVGDIGADAWTESNISGIAEQMDKKFQEFEKRLEALEAKAGK